MKAENSYNGPLLGLPEQSVLGFIKAAELS